MADDVTQKLKEKYVAAISVLNRADFKIQNIHAEGKKLVIRAEAPTSEASKQFWDTVKKVDANYTADLNAQITVRPPQQAAKVTSPPPSPQVTPVSGGKQTAQTQDQTTHTVVKGDTLSGLAKKFYGNANLYMAIFDANRDQLKDPDKIKIGQVLKIPPKPGNKSS